MFCIVNVGAGSCKTPRRKPVLFPVPGVHVSMERLDHPAQLGELAAVLGLHLPDLLLHGLVLAEHRGSERLVLALQRREPPPNMSPADCQPVGVQRTPHDDGPAGASRRDLERIAGCGHRGRTGGDLGRLGNRDAVPVGCRCACKPRIGRNIGSQAPISTRRKDAAYPHHYITTMVVLRCDKHATDMHVTRRVPHARGKNTE